MIHLRFRNLKNEVPEFGREVCYINHSDYGDYSFDFDKVDYQWDNENGIAIIYDPDEPECPEPEIYVDNHKEYPYKLYIGIGNVRCPMSNLDELYWIYAEEVDKLIANNKS